MASISAQPPVTPRNRRRRILLAVGTLLAVMIPAGAWQGHEYLNAASALLMIGEPGATGGLATYNAEEIAVRDLSIPGPSGSVKARLYGPTDSAQTGALVVVHGIHRLGIDEPRMVALARAFARHGFVVLTPEVASLADYEVTQQDVAVIGESAKWLRSQTGERVGVVGVSFAGGLALVAASDPRFRDDIALVNSIGGHHDLGRVLRYLSSGTTVLPDGTAFTLPAHEYGALVVAYSNAEHFFSKGDATLARSVLRTLLAERVPEARAMAEKLSPSGRARMALLFDHHSDSISKELLAIVDALRDQTPLVSPAGKLKNIAASVYILHGAGDNVVPPSEARWIEAEVPPEKLKQCLVSRAISHAEMGGEPGVWDRLALVHLMKELLDEAHATTTGRNPLSTAGD